MKLILKNAVFLAQPIVNFLRKEMRASVSYNPARQGYAKSIDIPDQYVDRDNIQILATYLYDRDALSNEDASTIVKNSSFRSIRKLADYWRPRVNELIDPEGFE